MKRFVCALLICVLTLGMLAPAAALEYNVAVKLYNQLKNGSGFSGVLSVELNGGEDGLTTLKPIVVNVDAIYVTRTAARSDEYRMDLTLMDGEQAVSAAHFRWQDEALSMQADVLSPDWYTTAPAADAQPDAVLAAAADAALQDTGLPSTTLGLVQLWEVIRLIDPESEANRGLDSDGSPNTLMKEALERYTTLADLWLEQYRTATELVKAEDGSTTMQVQYTAPAEAVKQVLKDLLTTLFGDEQVLARLQTEAGEERARMLLNPNLKDHYFAAIDALPLAGELNIARTMDLQGNTLMLHVGLPVYDVQAGNAALCYDRVAQPDGVRTALSMESPLRSVAVEWVQKDDTYTGNLTVTPAGEQPKTTSIDFELTLTITETTDDRMREVYAIRADGFAKPAAADASGFEPRGMDLDVKLYGEPAYSAFTFVDVAFTLSDEAESELVKLVFNGQSRKKWKPETVPDECIALSQMTQQDLDALLPGAALRLAAVLSGFVELPVQAPAADQQPPQPTPETFATLPPDFSAQDGPAQ